MSYTSRPPPPVTATHDIAAANNNSRNANKKKTSRTPLRQNGGKNENTDMQKVKAGKPFPNTYRTLSKVRDRNTLPSFQRHPYWSNTYPNQAFTQVCKWFAKHPHTASKLVSTPPPPFPPPNGVRCNNNNGRRLPQPLLNPPISSQIVISHNPSKTEFIGREPIPAIGAELEARRTQPCGKCLPGTTPR